MSLEREDQEALERARRQLENPGLAARMSQKLGEPIEKSLQSLPANIGNKLEVVVHKALLKSADAALFTLRDKPGRSPKRFLHAAGTTLGGAISGLFGASAMVVELPISTTLMLRSIADIARSHGESVNDDATRLACLEVFALGGSDPSDDKAETGYFAARAALSYAVKEAMEYMARNGAIRASAPPLVRLIAEISSRFGVQVSQKFVMQSLPVLGALGGAGLNAMFIQHYQAIADGHFTIRRLERKYGSELVRLHYNQIEVHQEQPRSNSKRPLPPPETVAEN